jgi:hypothetical protein
MRRESIFAQIERHVRFLRKMEERHKKHMASGRRRPQTCFQCRLEIARERIAAEKSGATSVAKDGEGK